MEATHKNLDDYRKGKAPLANAVLQHPEGSPIYDYLKRNVTREFWVKPFSSWQKLQKNMRKR